MSNRRLLRRLWENIIGSVVALLGTLVLLLVFLIGRFIDLSMLGLPVPQQIKVTADTSDVQVLPQTSQDIEPPVIEPLVQEIDAQLQETDNYLPDRGVYAVDAATLDATMANIEFEVEEKRRLARLREQEIAAAKRREEAARQRAEEERRQAEEAKRRAEEEEARRQVEEAKRKAEEAKRKAEAAKEKAEEEKRKAEAVAKKKAEEERRKAEEAKRKAEEERQKAATEAAAKQKAEEEKRKAEEAKKRAEAEAEAKAKANAEAKLASLNVGVPSLDGLQSAVPGYGQGDIDAYAATLQSAVQRYYRLPANTPTNLKAEFIININEQGRVIDVRLTKSSGYPLFDDEARNAITSASPLPLPSNQALRDTTIKDGIMFTFDP